MSLMKALGLERLPPFHEIQANIGRGRPVDIVRALTAKEPITLENLAGALNYSQGNHPRDVQMLIDELRQAFGEPPVKSKSWLDDEDSLQLAQWLMGRAGYQ